MEQRLYIDGMTCQNCRQSVHNKLAAIEGVSHVNVSLENGSALFDTLHPLDPITIQDVLGEKYTVSQYDNLIQQLAPSKWKQLRPLFIIFTYVVLGSILLSLGKELHLYFSNFMGLFYLVFSLFKCLDYTSFPHSFQQYDPIAKRIPLYGWIYPFIEIGLSILFLTQLYLTFALWVTLIVLGSTTVGVVGQLRKKEQIQCACLGTVLDLPMTEATLIENTIMLAMALAMLFNLV